jgi:hypothetical protein
MCSAQGSYCSLLRFQDRIIVEEPLLKRVSPRAVPSSSSSAPPLTSRPRPSVTTDRTSAPSPVARSSVTPTTLHAGSPTPSRKSSSSAKTPQPSAPKASAGSSASAKASKITPSPSTSAQPQASPPKSSSRVLKDLPPETRTAWSEKLVPSFKTFIGELKNPFDVTSEQITTALKLLWNPLIASPLWDDLSAVHQQIAKNIVCSLLSLHEHRTKPLTRFLQLRQKVTEWRNAFACTAVDALKRWLKEHQYKEAEDIGEYAQWATAVPYPYRYKTVYDSGRAVRRF